jgi:hypothetical protein
MYRSLDFVGKLTRKVVVIPQIAEGLWISASHLEADGFQPKNLPEGMRLDCLTLRYDQRCIHEAASAT